MSNTAAYTIAILYPGEMGSSLGKLLAEAGHRVLTTTEGRSNRTRELCRQAGLTSLSSTSELFEQSDVILSLVSPASAPQVARNVARIAERSSHRPLYVDANSISPHAACEIAAVMRSAGMGFVDGCILGLASQLRQRGAIYLSGSRTAEVMPLFASFMRARVAGTDPGQASALKMIISGIPKGLSALFVEALLFAREMGLLEEALATFEETYPALMEVVKRMLPTYPQHAARRCEELREVQQTMLASGVSPRMVSAACDVTCNLSTVDWGDTREATQWTVSDVIEQLHREHDIHTRAPALNST